MPHLPSLQPKHRRRRHTKDYVATFCLAIFSATSWSQAATDTWTGSASGTWDTVTSNWLDDGTDTLFNSGNDALFTGTPLNDVTSAAGLTIGAITLDNTLTGIVTLTGNNTVTGPTTISGGALKITHLGVATGAVAATELGTSAVTINAGGFLSIDDDGTGAAGAERVLTIANSISGSGTLQARPSALHTNGWSSVNFSGDLSLFTGTLSVQAGSTGNRGKVRFTSASQATVLSSSATVDVQSGATLYLNQARNYGAAVRLFGTGNVEGLGALRLEAAANQMGAVTLMANSNIGANGSAATISGNIGESGGSFGFIKVGNNTLTLTGSNTYSGITTINSGTLQVGNGGTTGTLGSADVTNNGTLSFNRSNDFTVSNTITSNPGAGAVSKLGAGKLTLSATNTIGNNLFVSAGTLDITGSTTIDGGGGSNIGFLTVAGNSSLTVPTGGALTILGTTHTTKPGSIVGQNTAGTSTLLVNGGTLTVGGNTGLTLGNNVNTAVGVLTISSGTATIHAGTTALQNPLNFVALGRDNATGLLNLDGGTLETSRQFVRDGSGGGAVGSGTATFNFNGGILKALASQTSGAGWFETATTGNFQVVTTNVKEGGAVIDTNGFDANINTVLAHSGAAAIDGGLVKQGAGTLNLGAANTYTGNTIVTEGVLAVSNASGSATGGGNLSVGISGVLAGTGRIAPSNFAGISINGAVAPGVSPSGIGTLTFDFGGTTGTGAMLSGAELRFELAAPNLSLASIAAGSSDLVALTAAAAGDFAFNSTTVNFLGTGAEGYYKLYDTSFDATTWTGLSFDGTTGLVSSGLSGSNLASGLFAEFIIGTAANGAESVGDIYVHVVPEPASCLNLLAGMGMFTMARRRRPQ